MGTDDNHLRFAITNKRLVKLSYSGSVRLVEPHDWVQKGTVRLLGYQLETKPGWRLFDVEKIAGLAVLETAFKAAAAPRTRATTSGTSSTRA